MALPTNKYPPKGYSEIVAPGPVPLSVVAGEPVLKGGDRAELIGTPEPRPVTLHIGNDNIVDIIAGLKARLDALEA